jgi:hypothetical protein
MKSLFGLGDYQPIDLAFRLLEIGEIDYCFASGARHEPDDGLRGFLKRFIRYRRGNRQLVKKYGLDLRPRFFMSQQWTAANMLLTITHTCAMRYGYHKGILKTVAGQAADRIKTGRAQQG